jgi:hypothetical protein
MRTRTLVFCGILILSGCGNPLQTFYDQLKQYGYIAYTTPLEVAGTGTLIGGTPKAMSIIANPNTCFPDVGPSGYALRFRDETVLPSTKAHFFVNTDIQVSFMKALATGAPSISAGVSLKNVSTMELEFQGVHVEYFDSVKLVDYYRNHMSAICQDYLDRVGFIIQAIVVDQMRFSLFTSDGGHVHLTVDNINQYLNISIDTEWEIDRTASLIIKTPKFIGYQLGELRKQDLGLSLRRATKTSLNTWVFTDIGIFPTE